VTAVGTSQLCPTFGNFCEVVTVMASQVSPMIKIKLNGVSLSEADPVS